LKGAYHFGPAVSARARGNRRCSRLPIWN